MCGIIGIVKLNDERVERDDIRLMASTLVHRGPDEAGFTLLDQEKIGFGHLRLSIIDLVSGQQPIFNHDKTICLVFNGEIYDYLDHKKELEARGIQFTTSSDSEVLIYLYQEFGVSALAKLNGEFAFTLWDSRSRRLLMARDRAGVKPLFYKITGQELLFASEAKAILALPRVERQISVDYITGPLFGIIPKDNCPFEGIQSLPPGHMLMIENGTVNDPEPYWQMNFEVDQSLTFDEAKDQVLSLLRKAVARRMVADVDVGVYLSGGLDSTLVCALMAEHGHKFRAFNIGFGGTAYDEAALSSRIARHYGASFESLDCSMANMSEKYLQTIYHTELALANPSAIAKKMLSAHVRQHGVKVCLTGEGADEVFGGYPYFKLEQLWGMSASGSPSDRSNAKALLKRFEKIEARSRGVLWDTDLKWRKTPWLLNYPSYHQIRANYSRRYFPLLLKQKSLGLTSAHLPEQQFAKHFAGASRTVHHPFNATRQISLAQLSGYIIPTLGDRVEMANSVECRTPFLDRDLMEFAGKIPPEFFIDIHSLREKHLLRSAAKPLLPEFVHHEHKHPFFSNNWRSFASTVLGKEIVNALTSSQALEEAGIFNAKFIQPVKLFWRNAPEYSKFFNRADLFFGFILGTQALHHQFIKSRPRGNAQFEMKEY